MFKRQFEELYPGLVGKLVDTTPYMVELYRKEDIIECCLDKQRVKDSLNGMLYFCQGADEDMIYEYIRKQKKELGLEDD